MKVLFIYCIPFFLCLSISYGQEENLFNDRQHLYRSNLIFESATDEDGRPLEVKFSPYCPLIQDRQGFLWFGTYGGLIRYDGQQLKYYKHSPADSIKTDIWDLIEDSEGYFWLANYNGGLSRFDPITETFSVFPLEKEKTLGSSPIVATRVSEDSLQRLWVGTRGQGLYRINATRDAVTHFVHDPQNTNSISSNFIMGKVQEDSQGRFWIPTQFKGLNLYEEDKQQFTRILVEDKVLDKNNANVINNIEVAKDGKIWFTSWEGLNVLNPDDLRIEKRYLHDANNPNSLSLNRLAQVKTDSKGRTWVASGKGLNLYNPKTDGFIHYFADSENPTSINGNRVREIVEDNTGTLWIGGMFKLNKLDPSSNSLEFFPIPPLMESENHSERNVEQIKVLSETEIWIMINGGGLVRFNPKTQAYTHFQQEEDNPNSISSNNVIKVIKDQYGVIWIVTFSGLDYLEPGAKNFKRFCHYYPKQCEKIIRPLGLFLDSKGYIWIGGNGSGLFRMNPKTKAIKQFPHEPNKPNGLGVPLIYTIVEDNYGNLWLSGQGGGLHWLNPRTGKIIRYSEEPKVSKSIPMLNVFPMEVDNQGDLWGGSFVGGRPVGPIRLSIDSLGNILQSNLIPNKEGTTFRGILKDKKGDIWKGTFEGIQNLSKKDGIWYPNNINATTGDFAPSGDFYCANEKGLYLSYLKNAQTNNQASPIVFTDFKLFNRAVPIRGTIGDTLERKSPLTKSIRFLESIQLEYNQNDFRLEFAALNFTQSRENQYKYMLEGYKTDTILTNGQNPYAAYNNLDHGNYRFMVWGSNNEGVWNPQPAILEINITPPWWETWWAKILYLLIGLASIFGYVQWRTITLKKRQKVLEQTVTERTAEVVAQKNELAQKNEIITKEKERSEELLLNILPVEIAEELKQNGASPARDFDQVTVLFTDFKQFTAISEQLSAQELVAELNVCFKAFDEIITKYQIEKIKTIGDAYMAAGGLSLPKKSTPNDVVQAALEMQQFMVQRQQERIEIGKSAFEMRCGIHTGPVVAGIVGVKKFQYDIWGDTVNIASRMESNGAVEKVNISHSTYELVRKNTTFNFIPRGKIEVKGKGRMEMYFVA